MVLVSKKAKKQDIEEHNPVNTVISREITHKKYLSDITN